MNKNKNMLPLIPGKKITIDEMRKYIDCFVLFSSKINSDALIIGLNKYNFVSRGNALMNVNS